MDATLVIGLVLSGVMGVVLGALGGGGSILTLPLLVYVLGVGTREAIAISLFVVAVTSAVALYGHARRGNVRWKTGLAFGATAMVGAFVGGKLAALVPTAWLLAAFTMMMVATGLAMLRKRAGEGGRAGPPPMAWVAVEGLVVGVVTGMVGAGGGFLVVPALVLLGGLPMSAAVGTSLLVIALKSFAGLAGHMGHVSVSWPLAWSVAGAAVVGAVAGGRIASRLPPARLRGAFAALVLGMATLMTVQQLSPSVREAAFVARWPFWIGGGVLGLFVVGFLLLVRRPLGVSTGYSDACAALAGEGARSWRLPFLAGIVAGGSVAALLAGSGVPTFAVAGFDEMLAMSLPAKASLFGVGGVLIGFGARLAGGCTSGHGIVGTAQLARSSIVATVTFMVAGFVVTNVFRMIGG